MKRLRAIFVLVAVVGSLLAACGTAEPKVYNDPSQIISVKVGQEFIISLVDRSASTGYIWNKEFDNSFLALVEDKYKEPEKVTSPMLGAPGTRVLKFKALKKGKTELTLVNRPAWWERIPPDEQQKIEVDKKVFTVNIN